MLLRMAADTDVLLFLLEGAIPIKKVNVIEF